MKGEGVKDIIKKMETVLGPIVKEVGPTVMKELVMPYIKKKMKGKGKKGGGLQLAGDGLQLPGAGLKLAGVR